MSKNPITKYLERTIDWNPTTRKFELEPEEHFYTKQVTDFLDESKPQPTAKELEPDICGRCGGKPMTHTMRQHGPAYFVECPPCGLSGSIRGNRTAAIGRWNAVHGDKGRSKAQKGHAIETEAKLRQPEEARKLTEATRSPTTVEEYVEDSFKRKEFAPGSRIGGLHVCKRCGHKASKQRVSTQFQVTCTYCARKTQLFALPEHADIDWNARNGKQEVPKKIDNLNPCENCGSSATIRRGSGLDRGRFWVGCTSCQQRGLFRDHEKGAAKDWNCRNIRPAKPDEFVLLGCPHCGDAPRRLGHMSLHRDTPMHAYQCTCAEGSTHSLAYVESLNGGRVVWNRYVRDYKARQEIQREAEKDRAMLTAKIDYS